jgi:hypothetical protein
MKRFLLIILPLLLMIFWGCEDKSSGTPQSTFTRTFGESGLDYGNSVQQTMDGGYVIAGVKERQPPFLFQAWLIKTDSQGEEEWNKTFGGYGWDHGLSVQQTMDGGYIVGGNSFVETCYDCWSYDFLLIKTDFQGEAEWTKTFGGDDVDQGLAVQQTTDGGYIITGLTYSFGNGDKDIWLIKVDSQGEKEWDQTFGGSSEDRGYSVQQTIDGGYIIAGSKEGLDGWSDAWLIKTDSQGEEEWNRIFDGSEGSYINYARFVQQTIDGGYIITGGQYYSGFRGRDIWIIKTDSQGGDEWNRTFGGGGEDEGSSVQQTTDGGYIITGYTGSYGNGLYDAFLLKTDTQGAEEWTQTFGGSDYDYGNSVQQTTDGGYIITGQTGSYGNGVRDVLLIKTDSQGISEPFED